MSDPQPRLPARRWASGKSSTVAHIVGTAATHAKSTVAACGMTLHPPVDDATDDWSRCQRCAAKVSDDA